jgi:hypothetical protein
MLQVLRCRDYVSDKVNENTLTAARFFVVSKVCDTVWTTGLIHGLHTVGMPDSSLLLLASYLTDCKFRVKIGGHFSAHKQIRAGVPKGAVLAQLLYNVYVADVPSRLRIEMSQSADDITAAFTSITQLRTCREIYII